MVLAHSKIPVNFHGGAGEDPQVQAGWVIRTAANAPAVMGRNHSAGDGSAGWPRGNLRPIGWMGLTHVPGHYSVRHTGDVRERLIPPWWAFFLAMVPPGMVGIAYGSAVNWWFGAAIFVVGGMAMFILLWRTAPVVAIDQAGDLLVARARLPRLARGSARSITWQEVDELLRQDARAYTALRRWYSRQAIAVDILDETDPHSLWIFSVRDSQGFALALAEE